MFFLFVDKQIYKSKTQSHFRRVKDFPSSVLCKEYIIMRKQRRQKSCPTCR
jgi:hypothetical protein